MFSRKPKNIKLNQELFVHDCALSTRFADSNSTATIKTADEGAGLKQSTPLLEDDVVQRLRCLEEHLGVEYSDESVLVRLKIIEDKIMRIEELYPQVAVRVFKYESEQRKGVGRLSKAPDTFTDTIPPVNCQNKKIEEMKQRLGELKSLMSK